MSNSCMKEKGTQVPFVILSHSENELIEFDCKIIVQLHNIFVTCPSFLEFACLFHLYFKKEHSLVYVQ